MSRQALSCVPLPTSSDAADLVPRADASGSSFKASPNAWKWFLAFEAVVALIYFPFGIPSGRPRILGVVPWMEWTGQVPAWSVLGLSAVAAIAYGACRYRPKAPMAWWFMGAGVLLFITGDTIYKSWHQIMGQQNIPFPSFIDAIYITHVPGPGRRVCSCWPARGRREATRPACSTASSSPSGSGCCRGFS